MWVTHFDAETLGMVGQGGDLIGVQVDTGCSATKSFSEVLTEKKIVVGVFGRDLITLVGG